MISLFSHLYAQSYAKEKKKTTQKKGKKKIRRIVAFLSPHAVMHQTQLTYTHSYRLPTYKLQYRKRESFTRLKPLFISLSLSHGDWE